MRVQGRIACACFCIVAGLLLATSRGRAAPLESITPPPDLKNAPAVAAKFADCFIKGREILLRSDDWQCVDNGDGGKYYKTVESAQFDPKEACLPNRRRMPTGLIREIVEAIKKQPGKTETGADRRTAIRIIGAAFCQDEVNLSDLDLPYPLVLDYGVFRFGIRADNFRTAGHLSIDGSFVFDNFVISGHSRIAGSIFGTNAFIQGLRIVDTDVGQQMTFSRSILTKFSIFDRFTVLGGLNAADSALSSFIMRSGKVGERLTLNSSEALCRYDIRNSEFAEFFADGTGFGTISPKDKRVRTWNVDVKNRLKRLFDNPAVATSMNEIPTCLTDDAEFLVVENTMRAACLKSFRWISAPSGTLPPRTLITLDDTKISRSLNINLWDKKDTPNAAAAVPANKHVLQIVGTEAATLIYDFSDNAYPYDFYVDRLQTNRIQDGDIACGSEAAVINFNLPSVRLVLQWLEKNKAPTTQPFLAFADAFQRSGADSTDLKVAKANLDFRSDLQSKWMELKTVLASESLLGMASYFVSTDRVVDGLRLSINTVIGYVADFGYRPYKSILVVVFFVLIFNWVILNRLKVSYAISELQNKKFELGPYFIFDYMIPLYSIDPAHAKIQGYYFANGEPIDAVTRQRLDRTLWWVRVVGLGAVVFLSATLKASVVS